ncbi:MAG: hypothetical protein ACOVQN_04265 [Exiguobacterium sp.]
MKFFILVSFFFLFLFNTEAKTANMAAAKKTLPFERHEISDMTLEQLEQLNLETLGDLEYGSCDELTFKLAWQRRDQLRREADERKAAEWRARAKASTSHPEEETTSEDDQIEESSSDDEYDERFNQLNANQKRFLTAFMEGATSERKVKVTKTSTSTCVTIE